MNSADKKHAEHLREALLALYHSGPKGFEGLLGIVLGAVTGQSFRLAKSGTQRGRDGDSAFDGGATYFEGKRYRKSPKTPEITAKLFDLIRDEAGQVDLWILGAPCEIASQTVADLRGVCERMGIGAVLLDWSPNDLGGLLIAIAAANKEAKDFIGDSLKGKPKAHLIKGALVAIDHFAKHPDLKARLEALRKALAAEEAALGLAHWRNREWLTDVLSHKATARAKFGQPLAPRDASGLMAVPRSVEGLLKSAFTGQPTGEIYAVVGDEGVGKSWLTASTWLDCDPASILIISPAEDLLAPEATGDFQSFLINKLIQHTGGQASERALERWRRRINGWRANPSPKNLRITMVFDGLNQPLKHDWAKRLDHAAAELAKLGGCLVITTRSTHWTQLKDALACKIVHVPVVQWTVTEVEGILKSRGIDATKVKPEVLQSLRNPRILGIALDLFVGRDVEHIEQLTVGRLMFEHLRKAQVTGAAPMSGLEFKELIKSLADETLARAQKQQTDDLRRFDTNHHQGLQVVASSRFFVPVRGSAALYEIQQDGLNIGLALSLVASLERELSNGRDPRERLAVILEPISALDEVASVVFLATQIACLDEEASPEVRSALIEHFVSLQNLPDSEADAFAILVRSAAPSFLVAAENVYCSGSHVSNVEWLLYALLKHRDDPTVWPAISEAVKRWLAYYSLAPERMMFKSPGRDADSEVAEERQKRQAIIDRTVTSLTLLEAQYRDANLVHTDRWRFDALHRTAFYLLAGKPLAGFADDLLKWSVSDALGPSIQAPDKEFRQLIRFNRADWKETRIALLEGIKAFDGDNSSTVGKWATVEILRATGDVADAKTAEELAEWLTRDREKHPGWSLVQEYCAVDPCDPGTKKPDNVDATAIQYRALDSSKLANHMGRSSEDHFFNMARAGVARFHIDDAVAAHRALATDVASRTGFARRQGALTLLEHSAALTPEQAKELLTAGQTSEAKLDENRDDRDEWLTAQYSIFTAIAHLSADEQLEAIAGIEGNTVMLDIVDAIGPASADATERVLERVLRSGDANKQSSVLGAIRYSRPTLSARSRSIVHELLNSTDVGVHAQALGVVAASADSDLLKEVVSSGWDSRTLRAGKQAFERWYGSSAILGAAVAGLIPLDEALDRMDLSHYGFAAKALGSAAAKAIAQRVDAALLRALSHTTSTDLPEMETSTPQASSSGPPLVSLNDPPPSQEIGDRLARFGETDEQFQARQRRMAQSFEGFVTGLTTADANLVLSDLTLEGTKALIDADSDVSKRWVELLNGASEAQLRNLHHFALQLSVAGSREADATKLLARIARVKPTINRVQGIAKVPSVSLALWSKADEPALRAMCKDRLILQRSDSKIALEVFAAYARGRAAIVEEVIDELLATGQPADTCCALTLAGFSDQSKHAEGVLARFEDAQGFIGYAKKAASQAYQRNLWARAWYERMRQAKTPLEFWQASVLLSKIVDLRFDLWSEMPGAKTETFCAFVPTVFREIGSRIEKWQKKRQDHLFGDPAPASPFLADETFP